MELTYDEKEKILKAARQSILSTFGEAEKPEINYTAYPLLKQKTGAFVTIKIDEELRGCIGYIFAIEPLFDTICESAQAAAFNDPRFKELTREEFDKIKIEISVLSPFEPINSYNEIELGKHGLLLEETGRAILLPQVATENNYTREQYLTALCHKAGMNGEYWKERMLDINVFTATVFSEK